MDALSPKASALVQAGRGALRPTAADRERIEAALRAKLVPVAATSVPRGLGKWGWRVITGITGGAFLIGGGWLLTRPPATSAPAMQHAISISALSANTSNETSSAPVAPIAMPALAPVSSAAVPAQRIAHAQDGLAREVALLSRATSSLRAGNAGGALKALAEHQRRFPNGVLSEERHGAKAQALCALGRLAEGRAELAQLAPASPAAARARRACDSVSASEQRR